MASALDAFREFIDSTLERKRAGKAFVDIRKGYSHDVLEIRTENPLGHLKVTNIRRELEEYTGHRVRPVLEEERHISFELLFHPPVPLEFSLQSDGKRMHIGRDIDGNDIFLELSLCGHILLFDKDGLLIASLIAEMESREGCFSPDICAVCEKRNWGRYKGLDLYCYDCLPTLIEQRGKSAGLVIVDISDARFSESPALEKRLAAVLHSALDMRVNIMLDVKNPGFITQDLLSYCASRIVGRVETPAASLSLLGSDLSYWLYGESEVALSAPVYEKIMRVELPQVER